MLPTMGRRMPIHFDPIRAHRSYNVLFTASAAQEYRAAGVAGRYLDIEGVTVSADGRTLYAYAVNFGALVVFEGLSPSGVRCVRFISGEI